VHYIDYSSFSEYDQMYGEFLHHVSVLDVLFNAGSDVAHLLALGPIQ
jgi:hypothetical protein